MRKLFFTALCLIAAIVPSTLSAHKADEKIDGNYRLVKDVPYYDEGETDAYRLERCFLDIYYPLDVEGFTTLVWFHGGGLTGGEKHLLDEFRHQGFAVVSVNYRLSPRAKAPSYIDDAAQAVAWVFKNIERYGGDAKKICLSGHSAGGYLDLMLALDKSYLSKFGVDADSLAKVYPISGQCATHYTIRQERSLDMELPIMDEYAPSNHARKGGAPIVLITGDRNYEMLARYEENLHLYSLLKHFGHPVRIFEMQGFNHGTVLGPAAYWIREDIQHLKSVN